jgi:hypothetical protein
MGSRSEAEETLKRTLVLAQRTADAAVAEANETAAQTVAESEARASRTIADAEAHAAVLRAEAEAEVRRVIESTRAPLVEEIKELERTRNFLRDDIELLENHLTAQRERLRAQLAEIQGLLDEPTMLHSEPTPETSGIDPAPALPPSDASFGAPSAPFTPPVVERPVTGEVPLASGSAPSTWGGAAAAPAPAPAAEPPRWSQADAPQAAAAPVTIESTFESGRVAPAPFESTPFESTPFDPAPYEPAADAGITFEPRPYESRAFDDAVGPPTQPVTALDDFDVSVGDSFLDQLRRVVDDDADEDGAMTAFFDQDDEERPRSRFGRRR